MSSRRTSFLPRCSFAERLLSLERSLLLKRCLVLERCLSRQQFLRLSILVALAYLGLSACREKREPEPGVAVIVAEQSASWIRNFNPFFPSQALWPAPAGIYEPLYIYNRLTQSYVPWLATKHSWNEDATRLTFLLREGVRWSDGRPLRPADVIFTWQLMKKHRALDQFGMWKKLRSVSAEGMQVVFEFERPFVPGLFFVAEQPIVAKHVWKHVSNPVTFRNPNPVGTGPFTEVSSFKNQVFELARNPYYWQPGKPGLKAIRMPAYPGNEQASLGLIRGEIDWAAMFIPAIDRVFVEEDPHHHGYQFPQIEGTVMLYPNHTRSPLDRVEVRKALSLAIDRPRIARIAMQGYTDPADATGLSDLYAKYRVEGLPQRHDDWTRFNPKLAGDMLDRAALERGPDGLRRMRDGRPLSLTVDCIVGWSDWLIAAQIIVRNLESLGITTKLRTFEQTAWFSHLRSGDFDLSMGWSSGGPTLYTFYRRQMSTSTLEPLGIPAEHNWQRFGSARADALLEQFAAASELDAQRRIGKQLQLLFVEHAPALPLFGAPAWGQYNDTRIVGFPTQEHPYAPLAPYKMPGNLLTLVSLRPRNASAANAARTTH